MNNNMLEIKKLDERAIIPTYGTEQSAGADLYALLDEDLVINPGESKMIATGLAMAIPNNYVGLIYARSSLGTKKGLNPANKVGVIDSDYRGEIKVCLFNHSNEKQIITPFERIAQIVFTPYIQVDFKETTTLSDTNRGIGGFGSTNNKAN